MVFAFFRARAGEASLDHIEAKSVTMLSDARHSFDLATLALLTDADAANVAADIRDTDDRINETEQELRSELVVHVAVQGGADIGSVLGFTLLLKKIERIGDQAKNILDLAEQGVSFAGHPEVEAMLAERQTLSSMFTEAGELLSDATTDDEQMDDFADRVDALGRQFQLKIDGYMTSDLPGRDVVPLAIYYRYLRRIVANLLGVVRTSVEPVQSSEGRRTEDLDD